MKKIIILFVFMVTIAVFYKAYNETWLSETKHIENLEKNICMQFIIPKSLMFADPNITSDFITEAANKSRVNIFRATTTSNVNDKSEYVKYVLLNGDTKLFNGFTLKSGRFLNKDDMSSNFYVSTKKSDEINQVGLLKNFGGKNIVTVKPFNSCYDFLPVAGTYFVETQDMITLKYFLQNLCDVVNNHYAKNDLALKPEYFLDVSNSGSSVSLALIKILEYANYLFVFIITMLCTYYVCGQSKRIGVLKLCGFSNVKIWWHLIVKFITANFFIASMVVAVFSLSIKDVNVYFFKSAFLIQVTIFVITIVCNLFTYILILSTKCNHLIKNKSSNTVVFILNLFCKVAGFIILTYFLTSTYVQYSELNIKNNLLKNWVNTKDYAVFYPVSTGADDQDDFWRTHNKFSYKFAKKLYPTLNKMGAILLDARQYEETAIVLNSQIELRHIKANNNYLMQFPIIDANGKYISVKEDETDSIWLVPEGLKPKEKEIMRLIKKERREQIKHPHKLETASDGVKNQCVKIIWMRDNQKIFSFNPDVFPTENNLIIDPIIQVVTENNSLVFDIITGYGGGARDAVKVKLIEQDTQLTRKILLPKLKELKMDDSLKHLVTTNQYIADLINRIKNSISITFAVMFIVILGLILLITQNIALYFERNKNKIAIKKIFGFGFFRNYFNYFLLISIILVVQTTGFLFLIFCLNNNTYLMDRICIDFRIFLFVVLAFILEILISFIAITVVENKNKIKVLKGGT